MANLEHVARLKAGAAAWNEWRRAHAETVFDFSGAELFRTDLSGAHLWSANLHHADRLHDKLLVVLSENSVNSPWVEREVNAAFDREFKQKRKDVLFPIRLDDSVMESRQALCRRPAPHPPHRRLPPLEGPRSVQESLRPPAARFEVFEREAEVRIEGGYP